MCTITLTNEKCCNSLQCPLFLSRFLERLIFVFSESSCVACECAVVRVKSAMVGAGLVPGCFLQDHSAGCVAQRLELSALGGAVGPHKPARTKRLAQQTQRAAHTPVLSGDHLHQVQCCTKQD